MVLPFLSKLVGLTKMEKARYSKCFRCLRAGRACSLAEDPPQHGCMHHITLVPPKHTGSRYGVSLEAEVGGFPGKPMKISVEELIKLATAGRSTQRRKPRGIHRQSSKARDPNRPLQELCGKSNLLYPSHSPPWKKQRPLRLSKQKLELV